MKILWRADSQHSWRLLISVLQQHILPSWWSLHVRSEDPDPAQLQHRETQRASLELHERFPAQIKSRQWLSGLQSPPWWCPAEGDRAGIWEFGCNQQILVLNQKLQWRWSWVLWWSCPERCILQVLEWLWVSRKVGCQWNKSVWNHIHVRLSSSDTNLPRAAASSSWDAALGRALWTAVVMLRLSTPRVCLPGLKCY